MCTTTCWTLITLLHITSSVWVPAMLTIFSVKFIHAISPDLHIGESMSVGAHIPCLQWPYTWAELLRRKCGTWRWWQKHLGSTWWVVPLQRSHPHPAGLSPQYQNVGDYKDTQQMIASTVDYCRAHTMDNWAADHKKFDEFNYSLFCSFCHNNIDPSRGNLYHYGGFNLHPFSQMVHVNVMIRWLCCTRP